VAARGTLRIYLGAAPGVGKTFAMLNEGRRRLERGTDVVVGLVETHGRAHTAAQIGDLEVVPRRRVEHRGTVLEEMDVDAVLARNPRQVLVDELAHTNVPGSRNQKRWQDIDELLDAGIDVISTVNIQHLESLNDVVATITGVTQRETVPDAWVRGADQIELEDMSPEALRRRMAHGNIYPAERVDAALGNYFRVGNLGALRELALLWVADRVDDELTEYRHRHGIDRPWETRERVVVALTGAPGGDQLVRRASRMALRAHGELVAVHVRRDDGVQGPSTELLDRHRQLVEELGGRYVEVAGSDPGRALVVVARAENATQIVLGASRRSRVSEVLGGSVIGRVLREAGPIDVHVISTEESGEVSLPRPARWGVRLPPARRLAGWTAAVFGPPLAAALLVPLRDDLGLETILLLFLLVAVAVAAVGGAGPGLLSAVSGFVLANWFFTPPLHTLTIAEPEQVLALVVFLAVAGLVSGYVAFASRRTAEAARARAEAATLVRLSSGDDAGPDRLADLLQQLQEAMGLRAAAVLGRDAASQPWVPLAATGAGPPQSPDQADAALEVPVRSGEAVLVVAGSIDAADRAVVAAFANRLGDALDARRLTASAAEAGELARGNELRAALLAAVSHDLRTPLAAIKASVTSLLADDVDWSPEVVREFCESIDGETDRLTALVSDLLDMSRISTGTVDVQWADVGVDELLPAALASLGDRAPSGTVELDVPETLPRVRTDPVLAERALANLIANAVAWSPAGEPVAISAGAVPGAVVVRIADHGPGIPMADRERVFQPFQRLGDGRDGSPAGIGLGLAVARGFVDALGAELTLEDTPGGGTTMALAVPLSGAGA
jgi:two-component system sensor histidine kinase KdpD